MPIFWAIFLLILWWGFFFTHPVAKTWTRRRLLWQLGISLTVSGIKGEDVLERTDERSRSLRFYPIGGPVWTAGWIRTGGTGTKASMYPIWRGMRTGTWNSPIPKRDCSSASCWVYPSGLWLYSGFLWSGTLSSEGILNRVLDIFPLQDKKGVIHREVDNPFFVV